jgi:divalent metal cation (Fe/Co/Zn/Cd) transporter
MGYLVRVALVRFERIGGEDRQRAGRFRRGEPGSRVGTDAAMPTSRRSLIHSAVRLSYATIGWNGVAGVSGLTLALIAGSPATAGFALNALLDSSASAILIWRFRREQNDPEAAEHLERRAQKFIVIAMVAVAALVAVGAMRALMSGSHANETVLAILVTALSLLFLPWLGRKKLGIAAALPSPALRGDGVLTLAAAALAGITLVALTLDGAFGWWWADPVAALVIAAALGTEAVRVAVRHVFG